MSEKVNFFMNEITDPKEHQRLLELCSYSFARIEIAWPNNEVKMETKFIDGYSVKDKIFTIEVPKNWTTPLILNNSVKATIFANEQVFGILFKALQVKDGQIICSFPEKLFKINRREAFRYKIPPAYEMKISCMPTGITKKFDLKILDISADGLGLILPPEAESFFKPGQVVNTATFKVNNKDITVDFEVMAIFKVKEGKGEVTKMGVKFKKFSHFAQGYITSFINTQVSQYSKRI